MNYNFSHLDSQKFEHLIQSLTRKILGNGVIMFGAGPDGGREATFRGEAPYPSNKECWTGNWTIQAKFKERDDREDNFEWVKKEFEKEMKKFDERIVKVDLPDNYLFFTNVVLTPVVKVGGRDKIEKLKEKYKAKIKNIAIIAYDDLLGFLENNRDIATSYASYILPGDILMLLYELLQKAGKTESNHSELLGRFLETEFLDDLQSRLDHAGKLTSDKINLEKVFVDLFATKDGIRPEEPGHKKFLNSCIERGNEILRSETKKARYVLIGGPGFGKSTITQFLCQIYRANYLNHTDQCLTKLPEVKDFLTDLNEIISSLPICNRFPFRIILKSFAAWVADKNKNNENHTFLLYLKHRIEKKGHGAAIGIEDIRQLLQTLSFVFIFDGLDEVPIASNRDDVLKEISNFINIDLRRYNCDALIIATSRPQGYTNEFESSKFKHLMIAELNDDDCMLYLNRLLKAIDPVEDDREKHIGILKQALQDDIVSSLMKSPLQASIMAILVKSGGEPPRNKYELFTEYYRVVSKREKQKNVCKILSEFPLYIDEIHYKVAFILQYSSEVISSPSSTIAFDRFKQIVLDYLKSLELETQEAEDNAEQILQATTERLVFLEEVEDQKIGFNIRSMQEYFAANYYVRNQPDNVISERMKYISKSFYWRNTFLFALGYLFKHKNYLIDAVESNCRELNGSTDDPDNQSITAKCKSGSWLALHILVEGIFRGHPKFENKFAQLLVELFTIPVTSELFFTLNLPSDIIQKWILNFIEKNISNLKYKSAESAWLIGALLFSFKYGRSIKNPLIKIFDKYWPNGKDEIELIKLIIHFQGFNNSWFDKKFLIALKKYPVFTFLGELKSNSFPTLLGSRESLIDRLLKSNHCDLDSERILLQNIFIISLDVQNQWELEQLFGKYPISKLFKTKVSKTGVISIGREKALIKFKEISLSYFKSHYSINFSSVKSDNKVFCELLKLFSEYNINYLRLLMEFLIDPKNGTLKKFIFELQSEPDDVFITIKNKAYKINWVLSDVFDNEYSCEKIFRNIDQDMYGDIQGWLEKEQIVANDKFNHKLIFFLKHTKNRSYFPFQAIFQKFYQEFYLKFISGSHVGSKEGLYLEFIRFALLNFRIKDELFINYLRQNKSVINDLLTSLNGLESPKYKKEFFNPLIVNIIYFLSEREILDIQNQEQWFDDFRFDVKSQWEVMQYALDDIFPRLTNVLNINLPLKEETGIVRLIIWVLLTQESEFMPIMNINFYDLHKARYQNPENEACRLLLCLFDPRMDIPKSNIILEMSQQISEPEPKWNECVIELLDKLNIKGEWVETFLLKIYESLKENDYTTKSEYENYLKELIENGPSYLNEASIQERLKLSIML
jgi:hypothetical protein